MNTYGCTLCGSTSHYRSTCPKNKWLFTRLMC